MINLNELRGDAQGFKLFCGGRDIPAVFTNARISRKSVPDGYHAYDIRGGDEEDFCSVEEHVLVNHTGTIITKEPLELDENGCMPLGDNYSFDDSALDEYVELLA